METQIDVDEEEIEDEEFKCCVCLELVYKPVVLACGHICCFWCVFRTMSAIMESNCPICRHPYNHFPSVCRLLHDVLKALYPKAYQNREMQIAEEEKKRGYFSPQFTEGASSSADSSKSVISGVTGFSEVVSEVRKESEVSCSGSNGAIKYRCEAQKDLSLIDFTCPSCKDLLFRPVVLNCGHVHCEHCLPKNNNPKCHVCESPNPNGLPKVCLVLDNLIAEQFRELHGQRRESLLKQADHEIGGPSNAMSHTSQPTAKADDYALWWTGRGPKVHIGVGCDYCGMSPIIGERYKCLDCTEKIGFDLCETCYAGSSVLPGRFNQQHKLDHRFEIKQPDIFNHVFIRPEVGDSDEDDEYSSRDGPDDSNNRLPNTVLPDPAPPS